jgi:RHS repeat-associated protein
VPIRDPLLRETRFTFDAYNRELSRTLPLGFGPDGIQGTADDSSVPAGAFTESFAYNDLGQQTLHVSFEGVVTQSLYDPADRLAAQRFFDNLTGYNNGAGTPAEVWTYKHDAFGREVEVTQTRGSAVRTVTSAYDGEGRLTQQSSPEGIVNYEYDDLGRKTRTYTGTAASPISDYRYGYDSRGRLATVQAVERNGVTLATPETTTYQFDLVGNLDLQRQANGTIVDYVYDSLNHLDTLTQYAPDATPNDLSDNPKIAEFDYTVRADGKRTAVLEQIWKDGPSQSPLVNQFNWTYDDVGRLTQEVLDSSDNSLDYTTSYKFDLAGNRVEMKVDQGSNNTIDQFFAYVYDANDRLLTESLDNGMNGIIDQITTYGWGVSNLGTQQTSKTVHDQATNLDTSRVTYGYDLQGRMETATTETLTAGVVSRREKVTYDYDDTGIRVSALDEIDATADGTFETRTLTQYLIDPQNFTAYQQVLTETAKNADTGDIQKVIDYTIGQNLIAQTTTDYINGVPQAPVTLTFGYDGHGSTRVLTDIAGAIAVIAGIQQVFHFDAYGNAIGFNPALAATTYLYSGEQWDQRIAMQYLRARLYDPSTGRFNSLDPFSGNSTDPQSFHKYLYAGGNPVSHVDPSGLFSCGDVLGVISIITTIVVAFGRPSIVGWISIRRGLPDAVAFGIYGSFAGNVLSGATAGGFGGVEVVFSPREGKAAFFWFGAAEGLVNGAGSTGSAANRVEQYLNTFHFEVGAFEAWEWGGSVEGEGLGWFNLIGLALPNDLFVGYEYEITEGTHAVFFGVSQDIIGKSHAGIYGISGPQGSIGRPFEVSKADMWTATTAADTLLSGLISTKVPVPVWAAGASVLLNATLIWWWLDKTYRQPRRP